MKRTLAGLIISALLLASLATLSTAQTREQTTIQTTTFDTPAQKGAVSFSYLNFPWGEVTFSYIELGKKDNYYGERTWPFAQLDNKVALTLDGTKIAPGQYALIVSPPSDGKPMSLSVVPFEGQTFVKAGNVFSATPKGTAIYTKDVAFATVDSMADHLKIDVVPSAGGFDLVVNYGNRRLTKSFSTK
jgi:hypothetical protein